MTATHFTGPVITGDAQYGAPNGPNQGYCTMEQQLLLQQTGVGNADYVMNIPAGSVILDFLVDALTAFNSATSAGLVIGNAVGGFQYVNTVDIKALTGRAAITYTTAQLAAMAGLNVAGGSAPVAGNINIRIATVGATSAGTTLVTVRYAQQMLNSSGVPVAPGTIV